jgi:hypothetical protein
MWHSQLRRELDAEEGGGTGGEEKSATNKLDGTEQLFRREGEIGATMRRCQDA